MKILTFVCALFLTWTVSAGVPGSPVFQKGKPVTQGVPLIEGEPILAPSILPISLEAVKQGRGGIESCGYGISLKVDESGTQVEVKNTYIYAPECPVFIKDPVENRDPRNYRINDVQVGVCGEVIATALPSISAGFVVDQLIIVDHSQVTCDNLPVATYEVIEQLGSEQQYFLAMHVNIQTNNIVALGFPDMSNRGRPALGLPGLPVDGIEEGEPVIIDDLLKGKPVITCQVYWEGYAVTEGSCKRMGASGCTNPFKHDTLESCMKDLATK